MKLHQHTLVKSIVWIGLLMVTLTAWAALVKLTDVRLSTTPKKTRIVFAFNKNTDYHAFSLSSPARLVVDVKNTQLETKLQGLNFSNTAIQDLRTGVKKHDLRLVFDLKSPTHYHAFFLKGSKEQTPRLVVDFNEASATTLSASDRVTKKHSSTINHHPLRSGHNKQHKPKPVINIPWANRARDVVVVIDPGHGGKDPGATGLHGTHEKTVVLAIAKRLKRMINQQTGMRAVLTRKGDYYITLRERLRLARKYHGDIFVAIHADAFKNRRARGASVYALSQRGATSEAARWLAEKENYSELGGVDLNNKSELLRSVLLDLSQTATIGASLKLGADVLHHIDHIERLHRNRVEQARFVVLKSPDIPSILIETGFISNPEEERRLKNGYFQAKLARSILRGIKKYFWQNPPPGTLISYLSRARRHVVRSGETLSSIAAHFHVSVHALKQLNELRSNRIRRGQTLRIPARG